MDTDLAYPTSPWYLDGHIFLIFFYTVHPCDKENKGGCEQVCNKDGKKPKCSCTPATDYKLNDDGVSCDPSKFAFSFIHNHMRNDDK